MCSLINCARNALKQSKFVSSTANIRLFSTGDKLVDITYNDETEVTTVTLKRRPVNALNLELIQQFNNTLDTLEKNKCGGMILTSALPTVFCAGLDIQQLYQPNVDEFKHFWSKLQDMWLKLYGCSFPTAAAINGHSPAGGCLLALGCDYRVMVGTSSTIGLNETMLGFTAPRWLRGAMTSVIGIRQSELALTSGRLFNTEEALQVGLIDDTATDKADAIKKAEAFLETMSTVDQLAGSLTKKAMREDSLSWLMNNREKDFTDFYNNLTSPVTQQTIKNYLESLKSKKK